MKKDHPRLSKGDLVWAGMKPYAVKGTVRGFNEDRSRVLVMLLECEDVHAVPWEYITPLLMQKQGLSE